MMRRKSMLLLIVASGALICGIMVISSIKKATNRTHKLTKSASVDYNLPTKRSQFSYDNPINEVEIVKEEKLLADPNAKGCGLEKINPFAEDVMKQMFDFGALECPAYQQQIDIHFNGTHVHVVAPEIEELKYRSMEFDEEGVVKFNDYKHLLHHELAFRKGMTGVIRNEASNRCISPLSFEYSAGKDIELQYTLSCSTEHVIFKLDDTGAIKHQASGFCIAPNVKQPSDNTPLVLTKDCSSTFTILDGGIIKFDGKDMCVHPLWGGSIPDEGQKICLWSDCTKASRLQYHLYSIPSRQDKEVIREISSESGEVSVVWNGTKENNFLFLNLLQKDITIVNKDGINIVVISLDEVSQGHFQRKLQKTTEFMTKTMKFSVVDGYASITSLFKENIMAMLNGAVESAEEALIYKIAKEKGYATLFASDDSTHKNDIKAHHNSAAYLNALARKEGLSQCFQGKKKFDMSFEYANQFFKTYSSHPKLAFLGFTELTKTNYNFVGYIDESLKAFLNGLYEMKRTVVIVNSVKGSLAGRLGQMEQGRKEHKRPFLAYYISNDLQKDIKINNHKVLTTPYDIHLTLIELLTKTRRKHANGISLFEETLPNRNCYQAGVIRSMCPCDVIDKASEISGSS